VRLTREDHRDVVHGTCSSRRRPSRQRLGVLLLLLHQEALDEDAAGLNAEVAERRLDEIHERPRAADVEVGIEAAPGEVGDGIGCQEPGVRVEVV
jgi:hypothetical protein